MKNQNIANQSGIVKIYQGKTIRIREDQYVCLSDMATASGKLLAGWLRTNLAQEYLDTLSEAMLIRIDVLIEVSNGNPSWAHPEVAIEFAGWCSIPLKIQMNRWLVELMTTGKVSIAPEPPTPQPQQRQLAPQRDVLDYLNGAIALGIGNDPLLKSLITQRMAEELGGGIASPSKVGNEPEQVIVTVRAGQLGYSQKKIGNGSALGTFVKKQHEPVGQTYHGKYEVNVYALTPELDLTIGVGYLNMHDGLMVDEVVEYQGLGLKFEWVEKSLE